jgi:8-oxo-dGTP diphosphatase
MPDDTTLPAIELIARGVLLDAGRILLCRNRKHGHQFLPGGHIELGESARAALVREMQEELGLKLRATAFIGVCESQFRETRPKGRDRVVHEINLVFRLEPPASQPLVPSHCVSQEPKIEFLWVDLSGLIEQANLLPRVMIDLLRNVHHAPGSEHGPALVSDLT